MSEDSNFYDPYAEHSFEFKRGVQLGMIDVQLQRGNRSSFPYVFECNREIVEEVASMYGYTVRWSDTYKPTYYLADFDPIPDCETE